MGHLTHQQLGAFLDWSAGRNGIRFRARSYDAAISAVAAGFGNGIFNLRPFENRASSALQLERRPLIAEVEVPALVVAHNYGDGPPPFIARITAVARDYFAGIGPGQFTVTTR